jgi:Cu(I)/Ag(I) efflux system periplasmic protein CusF
LKDKIMKNLKSLFILGALLAGASASYAMSHTGAPMTKGDSKTEMSKDMPMAASSDMTEGEVRKVDAAAKKITIKHGAIKNLDMPPMSMVFEVRDAAMLEKVKTGDKVRFKAEKTGGAIVVTDIQPAK